MSNDSALCELAERYWKFEMHEFPFKAFLAGQLGDEVILFRDAPADFDRRDQLVEDMMVELSAISPARLNASDRATYRLLERELSDYRAHYQVNAHLRPSLLPVGPDFNTVFYANSASVQDGRTARLHADRLGAFANFLADVTACLEAGYAKGIRYPRIVLEAAIANTRGLCAVGAEASPWFSAFLRSPAIAEPAVKCEADRALQIIGEELLPALSRYADFMTDRLLQGARESLACTDTPGGWAFYEVIVRNFTTLEMSPEAIHELGVCEVARVETEIDALAVDAGFAGDVQAYRHYLSTDPSFIAPDAATLREQLEVICKRIDGRIPAFFSRIPRITYGVDSVPLTQSAALPPAYAQPASSGSASAGMFWVSGMPEKCPSYLHPALAVHEAWPGHLMHIGLMSELVELPAFRRFSASKYTVYVEGWALYCEQLGLELGVYTTPHHHYGRLEMEMWRACRLVVDTGIHWYGWSRDKAIQYMAERLTLQRGTIAAEIDRYAALPGQALAYQIGGLKFRALRKRAETRLAENFSHRAFHEAVMTCGGVTLPVLDEIIDIWIDEQLTRPT